MTLEQYITKKHKSLQSQTNKDLGWSFFSRRHKLLSHWNLRLRICLPQIPFHMEGCMCICTSLKQNYIYIIWQCQDLEWQTLMNILPSKTSTTRLEEGCNTHILCNTHQSTNLGKPKKTFETILKHSHLRRF